MDKETQPETTSTEHTQDIVDKLVASGNLVIGTTSTSTKSQGMGGG